MNLILLTLQVVDESYACKPFGTHDSLHSSGNETKIEELFVGAYGVGSPTYPTHDVGLLKLSYHVLIMSQDSRLPTLGAVTHKVHYSQFMLGVEHDTCLCTCIVYRTRKRHTPSFAQNAIGCVL